MYMDEKQINVVNSTMTLDEWYDSWIKVCKTHCRDTTKRTYAIQYNRLREELGWRKLSQLNLVVLQDAFNQLATDTMREDCKSLLVDMLNRAVETELLNKNIAFGINTIIDNEEKEEKRILSNKEIDILLETSKGGQTYAYFIVALGTGMRMRFMNSIDQRHYRKCYLYCWALESFYSFFMEKTRVYDTIAINERRISIPPLKCVEH